MRTMPALLLLLTALASAQSAQYGEPPLAETHQHNLEAAARLDFYDNATALNATVSMPLGSTVRGMPASASIEPAGFSVSVDNVTCPVDGLSFIALRSARMSHLTSLPNPGHGDFSCDRDWFERISDETAWRCDLDGDYCAEYENYSGVSYDITATFSYGNLSLSVPYGSQAVAVPGEIVDAMRSGQGGNITVALNGTVTFTYQINDRSLSGSDCGSNYVSGNASVPYSANRSFAVGGGGLFLLRSPVLREQWAGDNRFDVVVLSRSPLYHADVFLNGNQARNITLRSFGVQENGYGIREIVTSMRADPQPGVWAENRTGGLEQNALDAGNRSFNYVYQFNYSYSGLGNNTLYLRVNDSCLVHGSYSDVLLSRMLSYNGSTMENGKPFDAAIARPSSPFSGGALGIVAISFGMGALLILISFTNFWLLK